MGTGGGGSSGGGSGGGVSALSSSNNNLSATSTSPGSAGGPLPPSAPPAIEVTAATPVEKRQAKALYDYDAADSSELSLLADEVIMAEGGLRVPNSMARNVGLKWPQTCRFAKSMMQPCSIQNF